MDRTENCVRNWFDFTEVDYESDDKVLFAIEVVGNGKKVLKMLDEEWFSVWMLEVV